MHEITDINNVELMNTDKLRLKLNTGRSPEAIRAAYSEEGVILLLRSGDYYYCSAAEVWCHGEWKQTGSTDDIIAWKFFWE